MGSNSKEYDQRYREAHKAEINAKKRLWRSANKDKVKAINARYYQKKKTDMKGDQPTMTADEKREQLIALIMTASEEQLEKLSKILEE